jgi:Na+/H+-dicarboxylate symporter
LSGNGGDRLQQIFESLNEVFLIILDWVLYFLPIGLFGLLASATATVGSEVLAAMGLVIGVNYLTMIILCLIYLVTIRIALSVSWKNVMAALRTPMMISFVTMDPFPAIPLAIENMAKYLKISRVVPGYSIPVTISLNGHNLTVQLAIVAVFLAQIYGIHLTIWDYLFVILCTAYPGSLAGPSLPTLLLMVPYVLGPLHLPVEPGVAVILISGPLLAPIAGIHTFLSGCANAAIIAISGPRELSASNKV